MSSITRSTCCLKRNNIVANTIKTRIPTVIPPAVAAYNGLGYVEQDMGAGKFLKKIVTGKWKSTFSEIYQNAIKGKVWKGTKDIWKIAPLLHHVQLNYLPQVTPPPPLTTEPLQMGQAAFVNNPAFSYILEKKAAKEELKKVYKMPEYKPRGYNEAA